MGKVKSNRKSNRSEKSKEKTVTKTNGFIGIGQDSNLIQVDIKDGKMVRIRPFYYGTTAEIKPWKINARGQVFEVPMKSLVSPLSLAYKNRVYSPNRILYPLKRVDWDPDGERNPQNRGKRGGTINTINTHKLTSKNATGMAVGGFLADVERADIDELRRKYPEAFRKPYDPAAGLCFERVLTE